MIRPVIVHTEGYESSADGCRLYWQRWVPDSPRAVLLLVHGLFEHGDRYRGVARYFTHRGHACYAADLRGHGRSAGPRVHVERFDEFLQDLETARRLVRDQHGALPVFLVGHSHGALVVLCQALRQPDGVRGLVLSSPLLGFAGAPGLSRARIALARALNRVTPSLRLAARVPAEFLSHDKLVVEAYLCDPLLGRKASPRWLIAALAAMREAHASAGELRLPMLLMTAGEDRIVDTAAAQRWARSAPPHLVESVRWNGLYHEIFNEHEKEVVFQRMEAWIEARLG